MAGNLIYDAGQDSGAIFIIEMGADDVPKPEYRAQQYLLYSFLVSETHRVSSLRGGINRAHAFAFFSLQVPSSSPRAVCARGISTSSGQISFYAAYVKAG
jgi:hypothetical protein